MDLSTAMIEKDLRPTRYLLTIRYVSEFVTEFFEQNPISQLGIIGMRDGLAIRISDVSGNPNDHISKLQKLRQEEPKGQPSLQNALDMARGALFHAPTHTTREVLLIFGSLLSSDPGDIHNTISALVRSNITCTVIGLAAQVAICRTLVERTNPSLSPTQTYNVALNEQHYRELLMQATTPPTTASTDPSSTKGPSVTSSLLMMGFPSRIVSPEPTLCACHSKPTRGGYLCSRCTSKVCALPTSCPACGLTLILSTHLARSYHHLFPLRNWTEVSWARASSAAGRDQPACFGCHTLFPSRPATNPAATETSPTTARRSSTIHNRPTSAANTKADQNGNSSIRGQNHDRVSLGNSDAAPRTGKLAGAVAGKADGVSESGRYACETCSRFFCIDCDVFAHEVVHNCPGCQSREGELIAEAAAAAMEVESESVGARAGKGSSGGIG